MVCEESDPRHGNPMASTEYLPECLGCILTIGDDTFWDETGSHGRKANPQISLGQSPYEINESLLCYL